MIVMDSGGLRVGLRLMHASDRVADFRLVFGGEAGITPPLQALLVGADAANTGGGSLACVGDITLSP